MAKSQSKTLKIQALTLWEENCKSLFQCESVSSAIFYAHWVNISRTIKSIPIFIVEWILKFPAVLFFYCRITNLWRCTHRNFWWTIISCVSWVFKILIILVITVMLTASEIVTKHMPYKHQGLLRASLLIICAFRSLFVDLYTKSKK